MIEITAMAIPPPCGVGIVWEQRSVGCTNALLRIAQERTKTVRLAALAITASNARDNVIERVLMVTPKKFAGLYHEFLIEIFPLSNGLLSFMT